MNNAMKVTLEKKALFVDSEHYNDVTYAIDREGKGMWVIVRGKEIRVANPLVFAKEMKEIWEHMKPRCSM